MAERNEEIFSAIARGETVRNVINARYGSSIHQAGRQGALCNASAQIAYVSIVSSQKDQAGYPPLGDMGPPDEDTSILKIVTGKGKVRGPRPRDTA